MNPLREKSAFSFPPLTAQTGIKRTSHFTARTDNHWLGITNVVFITFLNEQSWWQRTSKDAKWDYSIGGEEREKKKKEKRKNERKKGTLGRRFSWKYDTWVWCITKVSQVGGTSQTGTQINVQLVFTYLQIFISRVFICMYILKPKLECWVILSG